MKYAKLNNGALEFAPKNYKSNDGQIIFNFNLNEDLMQEYGYKPVTTAQRPDYPYIITYVETEDEINEIVTVDLQRAKDKCIETNDALRDETLLSGVTYQNVLFDSDTDQKVNLLATVGMMSDEDTITWFGMDNQGLLCSKTDLTEIGRLITELHSYCWQMNAYIKEQIQNAQSIEDLNNIEINYCRV